MTEFALGFMATLGSMAARVFVVCGFLLGLFAVLYFFEVRGRRK